MLEGFIIKSISEYSKSRFKIWKTRQRKYTYANHWLFRSQNIDSSTPSNEIYRTQPNLGPRNPSAAPEASASACVGLKGLCNPRLGDAVPTLPLRVSNCLTLPWERLRNTCVAEVALALHSCCLLCYCCPCFSALPLEAAFCLLLILGIGIRPSPLPKLPSLQLKHL